MKVSSSTLIPDWGSLAAPICIIGESPGKLEHIYHTPFKGQSGEQLETWWRPHGLVRQHFYITNVYPYYPPQSPTGKYSKTEKVPIELRKHWAAELHKRLDKLTGVKVIVPLGNLALNALMGWPLSGATITKHRGSVYERCWPLSHDGEVCIGSQPGGVCHDPAPGGARSDHTPDRKIHIVPSFHPAFIMRSPERGRACVKDWEKIVKVAQGVIAGPPAREHTVHHPTDVKRTIDPAIPMAVDIETDPKTRIITCVGFAQTSGFSFTIPTWAPDYAGAPDMMAEAWSRVKALCEHPVEKIVQSSGFYDRYWLLKAKGIELRNVRWNTYWMHHALDPGAGGGGTSGVEEKADTTSAHSLGYLASIYTAEPYWKDERKSPSRKGQLVYNGKDCCVTQEIFNEMWKELEGNVDGIGRSMLDYYAEQYAALEEPLFAVEAHGIRCDKAARKREQKLCKEQCKWIGSRLEELAGEPLVATKALSPTRLKKFLYGLCKLPEQKSGYGDARRVTTDEVALRKLMLNHTGVSEVADEALPLILRHRMLAKRAGTFLADKVQDKDGRVRCDYKLVPETGRLSSAGNPMGGGMNLQNVPPEARRVFTADEECVLLEVDLSTAEDRVVKVLTKDPKLIEMARTHPSDFDQHTYNASLLFQKPEAEVTKGDYSERWLVKRIGHGTNYAMGPNTLSDVMLNEEFVRTPKECEQFQHLYVNRVMPQLPEWHASIRQEIMGTRRLTNSWGRVLDLRWARLDNKGDTYRRGYAFKPQSEVGILVNQYGLIPMHWWLLQNYEKLRSRINLLEHDALIFSCPLDKVWWVAQAAQMFLERPRVYEGVELTIPVTFKVSWRWSGKEGVEWKRLPVEEEMRTAAETILQEATV